MQTRSTAPHDLLLGRKQSSQNTHFPSFWWIAAVFLLASACGESPFTPPEPPTDAAPNDPFASVAIQLEKSFAVSPDDVGGMTLIVFDEDDSRLYEHTVGDFDAGREIAVASASKLVSGLVLLRLVEQGLLAFDSTTKEILGWEGDNGVISLNQLGGFVSGLDSFGCPFLEAISLESCATKMKNTALEDAHTVEFNYRNSHLHVAARMAEVASSRLWQQVADDFLFEPLGIKSSNLRYYTKPKAAIGTTNPLIAGGLRATTNQYAEVLALLFHKGRRGSVQLISESVVDRMGKNHYTRAAVGDSPYTGTGYDYRYSFASWLECEGPVASCDVISSAGAFGFTPWVDYENRYYAILAMEGDNGTSTYAVGVQHDLQPLIIEALATIRASR